MPRRSTLQSQLDAAVTENARLKARVSMLRRLRAVTVITVADPDGHLVGLYTVPTFACERGRHRLVEAERTMASRFNLTLQTRLPVACDTIVDVLSEFESVHQPDSSLHLGDTSRSSH